MATNAGGTRRMEKVTLEERITWAEHDVIEAARRAVRNPYEKVYFAALGSRLRELDELRRRLPLPPAPVQPLPYVRRGRPPKRG